MTEEQTTTEEAPVETEPVRVGPPLTTAVFAARLDVNRASVNRTLKANYSRRSTAEQYLAVLRPEDHGPIADRIRQWAKTTSANITTAELGMAVGLGEFAMYRILQVGKTRKSMLDKLRAACEGRTGYAADRVALLVESDFRPGVDGGRQAARSTSYVPELAKHCGVERSAVYQWLRETRGVPAKHRDAVQKFIDARGENAPVGLLLAMEGTPKQLADDE